MTISLLDLPNEILIHIFSYLEVSDLYTLQDTNHQLFSIINDDELWKNKFIKAFNTNKFPSFSKSSKFSVEYLERVNGLKQWRHNRGTRQKYAISSNNTIEHMIFDYPKLMCYSDGTISVVSLLRRGKNKILYIPCTTPSGCTSAHFNSNAAVFGRYDGRIFGKMLTSKSYLSPVVQFNEQHPDAVSAIYTYDDKCVSGDIQGNVYWWKETKCLNKLKLSGEIRRVREYRQLTIAVTDENIFIIKNDLEPTVVAFPTGLRVKHFEVDFGGENVIIADDFTVKSISFAGDERSVSLDREIEMISMDESTATRQVDPDIAGGDGCYLAVLAGDVVSVVNIRRSRLQVQCEIAQKHIHSVRVDALVVVITFAQTIGVYSAASGEEIRTVTKVDAVYGCLEMTHGKIAVSAATGVQYLEYVTDADAKSKKGPKKKSTRVDAALMHQLYQYHEDQEEERQENLQQEKLRKKFMGDLDDEELQLQIAMMESAHADTSFEEDEELAAILEESRMAHERRQGKQRRNSDVNEETMNQIAMLESGGQSIETEDEELARVLALSMQIQ